LVSHRETHHGAALASTRGHRFAPNWGGVDRQKGAGDEFAGLDDRRASVGIGEMLNGRQGQMKHDDRARISSAICPRDDRAQST